MDLERQLRESLAAREPGAGFESAVMAQLSARQAASQRRRGWRVPAALAATLLASVFGLHWYLVQQREVHAHQKLMLAMQITSYELNQVQRKLVPNDTQENGS